MNRTTPAILLVQCCCFLGSPAAGSENELLTQVCADTPAEDSCDTAKNYPIESPYQDPERDGCRLRLDGTRLQGRYVDPDHANPNGLILLIGYTSDCDWGGYLIFDKRNSAYVFAGYLPGLGHEAHLDLFQCLNITKDGRDRLFCMQRFIHQGFILTSLKEIRFGRDTAGELHFDSLRFLYGEDNSGAYGANTVTCLANMEIIGFDDLKAGPTAGSTIRLLVRYVDQTDIRKACAPGAKLPKEVEEYSKGSRYTVPEGEAFVSDARVRKGYFVLDLETRQLVSEKGGKPFSPHQRVGY